MNDKGVSGTSELLSYPAPKRILLATDDNEVRERLASALREDLSLAKT